MIDLVLIRNILGTNIIQIWIVDVTASKDQIRPKIY